MPFGAILFDMDGTLLDTLEDLADSVNLALSELGFPTHPTEAYKLFIGGGAANLVTRVLGGDPDPETHAKVFARFQQHYVKMQKNKTRPYDGVLEMLDVLSRRGVRMSILSNKPHAFTAEIAKYYFPEAAFELVYGQRDGVPRKPDPAAALEIAQAMGVAPADFLYIGDSGVDMQTARSAGMFALGVLWGFRGREELLENGAQQLVERPSDILDLI